MYFVLKDQVKKVPPLGVGRSYVIILVVCEVRKVYWILKGFWLCQCFCWVMDLWSECEVLLFLDGVGCCCLCLLLWNLQILLLTVFWRCGGFWWYWWFDFYGLKLFLSGTYLFHLCIQLCSCWLDIFCGRLCHFSEHLELDLLDT